MAAIKLETLTLGILGCGNMGGAVARGILSTGLVPAERVFVYDPEPIVLKPFEEMGCKVVGHDNAADIFRKPDVVVLSIKPQVAKEKKEEWIKSWHDFAERQGEKIVVSVMAGIRIAWLHEVFSEHWTIIRTMPNLGLLVGEGATAIATDGLSEDALQLAEKIFQSSGQTVRVMEDQLDAVTGVSGSGPMYVFEFIEALTQAGVKSGLSRETAYQLAIQTAKGSLKLLESSDDAPSVWSARVRSPGGTTAEAQKVLEAGKFHELLNSAVQAAVRRSKELSA